jgi:hypothetical protein
MDTPQIDTDTPQPVPAYVFDLYVQALRLCPLYNEYSSRRFPGLTRALARFMREAPHARDGSVLFAEAEE